jgi:hypothetical protein
MNNMINLHNVYYELKGTNLTNEHYLDIYDVVRKVLSPSQHAIEDIQFKS